MNGMFREKGIREHLGQPKEVVRECSKHSLLYVPDLKKKMCRVTEKHLFELKVHGRGWSNDIHKLLLSEMF